MDANLIIAILPATLAAISGVLISLLNRGAIHDIHLSLNGRLSELLKITAEKSHLEGAASVRPTGPAV